jgi:hypothetical protein
LMNFSLEDIMHAKHSRLCSPSRDTVVLLALVLANDRNSLNKVCDWI